MDYQIQELHPLLHYLRNVLTNTVKFNNYIKYLKIIYINKYIKNNRILDIQAL